MINHISYWVALAGRLIVVLLAGVATLITISSCQLPGAETEVNQNTPTAQVTATSRSNRTSTVEITPTPAVTETPEDTGLVLTVWTVEEISTKAQDDDAGTFISNSLRNFRRTTDIKVEMLLKDCFQICSDLHTCSL